MKQLIKDLYYEAQRDLQNIKKGKLPLSDRVLLEKALTRIEDIKRVLDFCDVAPKN